MKLKHRPEDFQVEELTARTPCGGPHAFYRLRKRSLGTPEAVSAIARRWNIPGRRIAVGGWKDRHAQTVQFLTIDGGPHRNLRQTNLDLEYLGQVDRPYDSTDVTANAFHIVLRDLADPEASRLAAELPLVEREGWPNYFDAQRFGSLGRSGQFMAQAWCLRDFQRALWLALADPCPADRPRQRADKAALRRLWGQWPECAAALGRGPSHDVAAHLAEHPDDFRRALARLPQPIRRLHLEAFQSFLWNRILAALLRSRCREEQLVEFTVAGDRLPLYRDLDDAQRGEVLAAELPLPSARLHLEAGPLRALIDEALQPAGLALRQLQIDYPRDSFFSKGDRRAALRPDGLVWESDRDEVYAGRRKLVLRFRLPRGCYATILVRRLAVLPAGHA